MLRGGEQGADSFLMNGHMHAATAPIRPVMGEHILIRLMHAGVLPHAFHIHGQYICQHHVLQGMTGVVTVT